VSGAGECASSRSQTRFFAPQLPLVRASLYAQGSNLHVALWPGSAYLTKDITRFVAKEGRSFVVSASSILRKEDMDSQVPHIDVIKESRSDITERHRYFA
jgi:nitrilase